MDQRGAIFPCTELLHVAARTRGDAIGHLHWLAIASNARRNHCRNALRHAGIPSDPWLEHCLHNMARRRRRRWPTVWIEGCSACNCCRSGHSNRQARSPKHRDVHRCRECVPGNLCISGAFSCHHWCSCCHWFHRRPNVSGTVCRPEYCRWQCIQSADLHHRQHD